MLARLFTHLKKLHRASTQEERDAIYSFRYRVYVDDLHRELGGVDRERRMVTDEEDEKPYSHHFYVGSPADLAGTRTA